LKHTEDIVEIGRKLPGQGIPEIDFVMKGNIFVNVKNYDWADSFFQQPFGIRRTTDDFLRQAAIYKQYADKVKFVFRGSVSDAVRKALKAAGVIVEVTP